MDRPEYFQTALSNFVTDAACGGAVRHLTDIGYTLQQICDRLDYPASRVKVQKLMMEYLYESCVLLREEPSMRIFARREQFIQEQNSYGRRTWRKTSSDYNGQKGVTKSSDLTFLSHQKERAQLQDILWRESAYEYRSDGKLTELIYKKCEENGEECSYMSCSFSFLNVDQCGQNMQGGRQGDGKIDLSCLNSRQREYLSGIRWEEPVLYHRLDQRMREILVKLYEAGYYRGACFFLKTREKLVL